MNMTIVRCPFPDCDGEATFPDGDRSGECGDCRAMIYCITSEERLQVIDTAFSIGRNL